MYVNIIGGKNEWYVYFFYFLKNKITITFEKKNLRLF